MRQWEIWVWYLLHLRSFATRSTDPVAWAFETAPTMSHCTERAARATERKDFLSHWARECYFHLLVLISSDFLLYSLFFLSTPWGQPCHQPARRYRSNLSEKYQVQVVSIWSGPKSHYKSEILGSSGKEPRKAPKPPKPPNLFFFCCCSSM